MVLPRNILCFFGACFFFLIPLTLHAAAWTLQEGNAEWHQALRFYRSDTFLDQSGQRSPQPRYSKQELDSYAEFGLRDDLTIGTQFALYRAKNAITTSHNLGVADPSFFIRQRVWQNESSVFSIQPLIKLPSFSRDDQLARSGTDAVNLELRLQAGHSFQAYGQYHFLNLETAYRKRFEDFGDQVHVDLTAGVRLDDRWTIMPQLFSTWRLSSDAKSSNIQIFDNDYDQITAHLSTIYDWNETISSQLGVFYDVWGQNLGRGEGLTLTTSFRF